MSDRIKENTIAVLLVCLSPIGLFLGYADFEFFRYNTELLLDTFNQLPWIRISILLTIITVMNAQIPQNHGDKWGHAIIHSIIFVPLILILANPRFQELNSNPYDFVASFIFLSIIHSIGFKELAKLYQKNYRNYEK